MTSFGQPGIAPQTGATTGEPVAYNVENFAQIGVTAVWEKYGGVLNWGKGQCLAILDDGCDLSVPQWQAELPWGKKVVAAYNSFDDNDDPTPVPPGYHGTTVGYPSSLNHDGVLGVACNNSVAQVRCATVVHLPTLEVDSIGAGLRWVIAHAERYNITTVNLSPLDDVAHAEPVPTALDALLQAAREKGIWVSAPCGNNGHVTGISWPACQPGCFAIGAVQPGTHLASLDRYANTDLLVAAVATSSSNAYAAGSAMILREAIALSGYRWQDDGATLPAAIMAIFQRTGLPVDDPATGCRFRELNLLAAVDAVMDDPTKTTT